LNRFWENLSPEPPDLRPQSWVCPTVMCFREVSVEQTTYSCM
jgi:hypothetical protein